MKLATCLWLLTLIPALRAASDDTNKGYIGVGLEPDKTSELPIVDYVPVGSPAAEAGVRVGDRVVAIDNASVAGRPAKEVKEGAEGSEGTTVRLTLRRAGGPDLDLTVVRRSLLAVFTAAAAAGDARAEYGLGWYYERGPAAARDLTKAAEWYGKSAAANDARAQAMMGYLCQRGLGTTIDLKAAAAWYLKAATQGDASAEINLGRCYLYGLGIPRDERAAFAWFYTAARQDNATAEHYLGLCYRDGRGVPRDERAAFAWFYRSAQQDNSFAEASLAYLYENGYGVSKNDRAAFAWYYRSAGQDDAAAELNLAICYRDGRGVTRDDRAAFAWFDRAARSDNVEAELNLALCYRDGLGVAQDDRAAFNWFYRSAQQGNTTAEVNLGYLYQEGRGVERGDRAGFNWYYAAARQGDSSGEQHLGSCYAEGRGVDRDDRAAVAWYYRSALAGYGMGQWDMGYMYDSGRGVRRDEGKALDWYLKAAVSFPVNRQLKESIERARWEALLRHPESWSNLDVSALPASFKAWFKRVFFVLAAIYLIGALSLLYVSFRSTHAGEKLSFALGWLAFYIESQGLAFYALCYFGATIGAGTLLGAMSALGALPVLLSSCGPVRSRLWKRPVISPLRMLAYCLLAYAAMIGVGIVYNGTYWLLTHARLPGQPTLPLLVNAKAHFAWITYLSVALLMPVAEEIIFRGYLFDAARRYLSDRNVVIVTALVFSVMHFQLLYFVPIMALGVIMGWMRLRTGSLWLPVLFHAMNNGIAVVFSR